MEEEISKFCKSLSTFCDHLQNSSSALKQSMEHRPVPLDSASTTFKQSLIRRVTSASTDIDSLESMSFGTVSLEELIGHCNEVYKKNQTDVGYLKEFLSCNTSYIPLEDDHEEEEVLDDSKAESYDSCVETSSQIGDDHLLLDNSLSLKSLGLSDACLATIASKGATSNSIEEEFSYQSATKITEMGRRAEPFQAERSVTSHVEYTDSINMHDLTAFEESKPMLMVSRDDFETLPSFMKSLASWEDLLEAVEKVNAYLRRKGSRADSFRQDETSSLELGPKTRSYLMLLIKLNGLAIQSTDGLIHYKVVSKKKINVCIFRFARNINLEQ